MEQKTKKYSELNKYERAMTNLSLEQRLEAMARDVMQISQALKVSINVDSCFHDWAEDPHATARVVLILPTEGDGGVISREVTVDGSCIGLIEEAMSKKAASD